MVPRSDKTRKIWITSISLDELNTRSKNTLVETLAIRFTAIENDALMATMPLHIQPMGILHGGASAALAETVGSAAANYCVDQRQSVCVGLDLNINHLKPVKEGHVHAIAKPLHLGKTTQVWEIRLTNDAKELIAIARLTMAVLACEGIAKFIEFSRQSSFTISPCK